MANTRFIHPDTHAKPPGYTHVVEVTGPGRLVFVSGQLGMDREGAFAPDFRGQATQVFQNLKDALAAVGGRLEDIVKTTTFMVDKAHMEIFREVRPKFMNSRNPPASTLIFISSLARPGALIEIEAIAALPLRARRAKTAARRGGRPARTSPAAKKKGKTPAR